MKTTTRFDNAMQKLYTAFHDNTLNPECCKQCAVGNILDNTDSWKHLSDFHGSLQLNYVGLVNEKFGKRFNGYSPSELLQIEATFLKACGYEIPFNRNGKRPTNPKDKDLQFKAMSAVVALLCKLDGIKNVMDYSRLFEFKTSKRKPSIAYKILH